MINLGFFLRFFCESGPCRPSEWWVDTTLWRVWWLCSVVAALLSHANEIRISGSSLPTDYALHSFHFHWGTKNRIGSEHMINGDAYPMEVRVLVGIGYVTKVQLHRLCLLKIQFWCSFITQQTTWKRTNDWTQFLSRVTRAQLLRAR